MDYESSQWLSQLGTIQKQMHAGLREGIDLEFNKDDGSVKMVEKKTRTTKMLFEPNISYKPFWGICRPLKSWRANSPNPIQIYCVIKRHHSHLE